MTHLLLRAAVQEHSREQDVPGEMLPLPLPGLWESRRDGDLAFKNPGELLVSWWERGAQEIIFSSRKPARFSPWLPRCCVWWIRCMYTQGQATGK